MAFFIELAAGDTLVIGSGTRVRLEHKSGARARLRIDSDEDIERVRAGDPLPTATKKAVPPTKTGGDGAQPFLRRPS